MLPFMKPEKAASVIVARLKDHKVEAEHEEGGHHPVLKKAATDLMQAIHMKDASAVAEALKDAFLHLDSEPHEEGPHEGEE